MTTYFVGKPQKNFFKSNKTWDWFDALEAVQDGDTIELEEGFCPKSFQNNIAITLSKNITIKGNCLVNNDGSFKNTNIIDGIFITNNSSVKLENLIVERDIEKANNINVKENSSLICKNVLVRNTSSEGIMYPLIFLAENSSLVLLDSVVSDETSQILQKVYISDNSSLEIYNTKIYAGVESFNSNIISNNAILFCYLATAVYLKDSILKTFHTTIDGGMSLENETYYPSIKSDNSKLEINHSTILHPTQNSAILSQNSDIQLFEVLIDSLRAESSSEINILNSTINKYIQITQNSKLVSKGFNILGYEEKKINFFAERNSIIDVGYINFGYLTSPNIKIEKNVSFEVKQLNQLIFDKNINNFIFKNDNTFSTLPYNQDIQYFGDLPAYQRLNDMIGLNNIKISIEEFVAVAEINKKRELQGLGNNKQTLHSLFLGNPGTGKTSVARIIGELLFEKQIISKEIFIEASRSDLVGQYIGHTAIKTKEILESALGGVLFIDEAYTLSTGGPNDFGLEAINEILKFMEDHRQDIVIIFAGYTQSMNEFLNKNEGLRSRIPNVFTFTDYTIDDLIEIGWEDLINQKYILDKALYSQLVTHNFSISNDNSNGRWIRNLNEQLLRKLAVRLSRTNCSDLSTITEYDIKLAMLQKKSY